MGFKHNNGMALTNLAKSKYSMLMISGQFSTQTTSEKTGSAGSALGSISQAPKFAEDKPARSRLLPSVSAL
jgi:hypothetical protein